MDGRDAEPDAIDLRVELEWDDYNTGLFTEKLIRHVRRDELEFDLAARSGPPETTYSIVIVQGNAVPISESVARYLFRRVNRAERNLPYPLCAVYVDDVAYETTIREEEDVRAVVERAHQKVKHEDQRNLDEF